MLTVEEDIAQPGFKPKAESKDTPAVVVSLPSKGVFNANRKADIRIAPFTVSQVRRIYSATLMKVKYDAEATFAAVLADSVLDFNLYEMTIGDYEFIKKWIRINSYKKSPMILQWLAKNEDGTERKVTSRVETTSLQITELEPHYKPSAGFAYTTVRDHLDLLKIEDQSELKIAEYASFLSGKDLATKIERFDTMNAIEMMPKIREYQDKMAHGVDEYVLLKDDEARDAALVRVKLDLSISDFFP